MIETFICILVCILHIYTYVYTCILTWYLTSNTHILFILASQYYVCSWNLNSYTIQLAFPWTSDIFMHWPKRPKKHGALLDLGYFIPKKLPKSLQFCIKMPDSMEQMKIEQENKRKEEKQNTFEFLAHLFNGLYYGEDKIYS